ncbi:MAG: hypothetical protein ABJN65_15635 [Parasphingorhabdus sp.]
MNEPKPLASLSSSLLARKGKAKPAMRRQGINFPENAVEGDHNPHEDLGWNDMGYDTNPDHNGLGNVEQIHHNPLAGAIPETVPAVKQQQEEIATKLAPEKETKQVVKEERISEPVPPPPLSISKEVKPLEEHSAVVKAARETKRRPKKARPATKSRTRKAKAAFTLRLDADRHLKLRLATAVKNVSAQQLVTKAVDEYLKNIPELDDLAQRVPSRGTQ